jgi:hypothetical protein
MRALQDLDGNLSLNLSLPVELEYFGATSMEQVGMYCHTHHIN